MASAAKTKDFASSILNYFKDGTALPVISNMYIGLLSALPSVNTPGAVPPYTGTEIKLCEVSAGDYRVDLGDGSILNTLEEDTNASAMRLVSNGGEVTWPDAPANFNVSGYCICSHPTNVTSDVYIAYELFDGTNKGRTVIAGDSIKINTGGLVIKEK